MRGHAADTGDDVAGALRVGAMRDGERPHFREIGLGPVEPAQAGGGIGGDGGQRLVHLVGDGGGRVRPASTTRAACANSACTRAASPAPRTRSDMSITPISSLPSATASGAKAGREQRVETRARRSCASVHSAEKLGLPVTAAMTLAA